MASQGPLYPGTVATEVGPSGDNDWTNPGNISADDGSLASITEATFDSGDDSYRLKATNFGFTIPAGATIDGIIVEIERSNAAGAASDNEVRLYDSSGTLVGSNKAAAGDWPVGLTLATYGSSSDTWASGLDAADINSAGFGVAFIANADGNNTDIAVDYIRVTVHYTESGTTVSYDQAGFRGRNDDGNETTATWKASENTNWFQVQDTNFRVRFVIDETASGTSGAISDYKMQYRLNGGTWTDVRIDSSVVRTFDSANLTNGEATTRQLSSGTGTFVAGTIDENNGAAGTANTIESGEVTELEFVARILSADVAGGDTVELRIVGTSGSVVFDTYSQIPSITVDEVSYTQAGFRGRNDDGSETTATWKAAENTNWTQDVDENVRVRFVLDETTGGSAGAEDIFQLQYRLNGGTWTNVDAASNVVRTTTSPNVANATATTRQLSSGTGTFEASEFDSNNGLASTTGILSEGHVSEPEYCVQIRSADVSGGDTVELRVIRQDAATLNVYSNTPSITVATPGQTENYGIAAETDAALAFAGVIGEYAAEVLADDPFLYWRLGESSGSTAEDSSGNNRDGTYINTPTLGATGLLDGDADTAITLTGTNLENVERVVAGVTGGDAFSIECWVKIGAQDVGDFIFIESLSTGGGPITALKTDTDAVTYQVRNDSSVDQVANTHAVDIYDDTPHHIVVTDEDVAGTRTYRIYVDGVEVASDTYTRGSYTNHNCVSLGARFTSSSHGGWINGTVDEFALYEGALSDTRVQAHYLAGAAGQTENYGIASETDAALAFTHEKLASYGIASETDAALALIADRRHLYGIAAELDAALAYTGTLTGGGQTEQYGIALETDAALAFVVAKLAQYGLASETDAALSLIADRRHLYLPATETDSALTVVHSKLAPYGVAAEVDAALSIAVAKLEQYGIASETDAALAFAGNLGGVLAEYGVALETDEALALVVSRLVEYGIALEVDRALHLDIVPNPVTRFDEASEDDRAMPFEALTAKIYEAFEVARGDFGLGKNRRPKRYTKGKGRVGR